MKIQASVRRIFDEQLEINIRLKTIVDNAMTGLKQPRWHYESRLKEIESFAVKLETGRVDTPSRLEDFLACTLVVPNSIAIAEAISLVSQRFAIKQRRPTIPTETKKSAECFPFDDLRLYCFRPSDEFTQPDLINGIVFEVQIKTFLQHAWSIATHDLSYKTDEVSWSKDRIVAHLRAAIEYSELSIREANTLAASPALALAHSHTAVVAQTIAVLKKHWERDLLPTNLRALAQTLSSITDMLKMTPLDLDNLLGAFKGPTGLLPLNLSPYGVVLSALLSQKALALDTVLRKKGRTILLLTPELTLPPDFPSRQAARRTIRLT